MEKRGRSLDVAMLCHGWYPDVGGVESHTRDLARELLARGHTVRAMGLDYGEDLEPYSVHDVEVEGVRLRRMAYRYHDHRALADVVENPRAEQVIEAWLAETRPDVLHVHHVTGFGLGALRAARRCDVPVVMTLHDYWPLCPRGQMMRADRTVCRAPDGARCGECLAATWPHLMPAAGGEPRRPGGGDVPTDAEAAAARTAFALDCLQQCARLLIPSAAAREVYAAAGLAASRIEVCANGVETEHLAREVAQCRLDRPRDDGEVRLGLLGTVLPSKGSVELARSFLAADVPGMTLEVHGHLPPYHGDASYVEELQALAVDDGRVRIHGPYDYADLPAILAGLDGVVAPSRWVEVYGLTVREAAAAGLPVLVSDAGDLVAVADGGRAGIVVPPDDRDAWVQALRRFGTDTDARAAWAGSAPPLRSTGEMTDQIEGVYRDVLPRPGFLARLFNRG